MSLQKLVEPLVDTAANDIYRACLTTNKSHLATYLHIREVLTNLAIDTVEVHCDTIKEKK